MTTEYLHQVIANREFRQQDIELHNAIRNRWSYVSFENPWDSEVAQSE